VHTVQCWLMRFFGPQAAPQSVRVSQVDFADGLPTIDLVSDLVIRAGQRLALFGNGATLRIGKRQVQVHPGGALEMTRLGIAESAVSSAIVVEGVAAFANCTFVGCSARLNVVSKLGLESRGGAIAVIGGGHLLMLQCSMRRNAVRDGVECSGGALLVSASSSAELNATELSSNIAVRGQIASYGGAVHVRDCSSLRLVRSSLAQNVADGGNTSVCAYAGAVYIDGDSVGEVNESEMVKNLARLALRSSYGGALFVEGSRLVLAMSKINRNLADGNGQSNLAGGAIFLTSSVAEVADCEVVENVARGGVLTRAGTDVLRSAHDLKHGPCFAVFCLNVC
jgi:hypothetical protein